MGNDAVGPRPSAVAMTNAVMDSIASLRGLTNEICEELRDRPSFDEFADLQRVGPAAEVIGALLEDFAHFVVKGGDSGDAGTREESGKEAERSFRTAFAIAARMASVGEEPWRQRFETWRDEYVFRLSRPAATGQVPSATGGGAPCG